MDKDNKLTDMILHKLDALQDRLNSIDITLAKQHEQLATHIKRSDQQDHALKIIEERIKPIEKHVITMTAILKIVSAMSAIVLFFISILKFVTSF